MTISRYVLLTLSACILVACAPDTERRPYSPSVAGSTPPQWMKSPQWQRLEAGPEREITPLVISPHQIKPTPEMTEPSEERFTLTFRQGPIRQLAQVIVVDILQSNLVVDPSVTGDVSVDVAAELNRAQLVDLLDSTLNTKGATLEERAGTFFIRSRTDTAALGQRAFESTKAIALSHTSAKRMQEMLGQALPSGIRLSASDKGTALVVSGPEATLQSVLGLVTALDKDTLSSAGYGLIPLEHADADDIIRDLTTVIPETEGLRVQPIKRMNALLLVARNDTVLKQARTWISRLDRSGGYHERSLFSYHPVAARTEDLARLTAPLIGARILGSGNDGTPTTTAVPYGDAPRENRLITPVSDIDLASQKTQNGSEKSSIRSDSGLPDGPALLPDSRTNVFLAHVTEQEWKILLTAMRRLDRRPAQIMIEAAIVEIELNDELRYGLRLFYEAGQNALSVTGLDALRGLAASAGFGYTLDTANLSLTLEALSSLTQVKVVSSPKIMVVNNETAALQIGDQVPIAIQSAVPTDAGGGRIVNSIELRDTGVILKITPRVTTDGIVSLALEQEVSDVAVTTTSNIDSPTIRQRRVKSTVDVESGKTIAMAGLTRESENRSKSGIPGLRDIPIMGALFGNGAVTTSQSELLVFLTPRIIAAPEEAVKLTSELQADLDRAMAAFIREL